MIFNQYKNAFLLFLIATLAPVTLAAQQAEWQQRVEYEMDVHLDVERHIMTGTQQLTYYNNSPDTLHRVYYHLYYNAFQPGSMMDVRSRTILDWDSRVRDRIYHLEPHEIGYQEIAWLNQNGRATEFRTEGTILIVDLPEPILPGSSALFEMEFEAQVPVQIRRTGRDNREGIAYSMAQWYPRMAAYDAEGWHTHPYIGREFHGIFGDFDVRISIDRDFVLGGTGYLQNPQEIGHGYEDPDLPLNVPDTPELTWHFFAPDVIDFMWGADPHFTHRIHQMENGPRIHLLYVEENAAPYWEILDEFTAGAVRFVNEYIGEYPYEQFTIIQGGDGGMEYPMATLITGQRPLYSLVAVTVHELLHMWFQSVVATNESLHHWMDEGFTVYASELVMRELFRLSGRPHQSSYNAYFSIVHEQLEEPMGQHADHYETNRAYSVASYRKGALILHQLEYIVGADVLKRSLQRYYREWGFRHPTPTDFRRVVEKESGLQLGWYFEAMLDGIGTVDLAIGSVRSRNDETEITLENRGDFLMPVDLLITYEDGSQELIYIPTHLQLGQKVHENPDIPRTEMDAWFWTHPEYTFTLPAERGAIKKLVIDPSYRLADVNRLNNEWPSPVSYSAFQPATPSWERYNVGWRPALWYGENAGVRAGIRLEGRYQFNTRELNAGLMLTSGRVDDYDVFQTDVDLHLSFRDRFRALGPAGWWSASVMRYYGVNEGRINLERQLGKYGSREPVRHHLTVGLLHQSYTANRNVDFLNRRFENGNFWGVEAVYELEQPEVTGVRLELRSGTFDERRAAHRLRLKAGYTLDFSYHSWLRFGLETAFGSTAMPLQHYMSGSGDAAEDAWRDQTYWSFANIDPALTEDLNLVFNPNNPLAGYAIPGTISRDQFGNNLLRFSIRKTFRPALTGSFRPLTADIFAGAGRSWFGAYLGNFPEPESGNPWLASLGAGLSYDVSELPGLRRWVAQSSFLSGLKLGVNSPFYLHGVHGEDDWSARFMFSVSR